MAGAHDGDSEGTLVRPQLRSWRPGSIAELRRSIEHPDHEVHKLQATAIGARQPLSNGAITPQHSAFKGWSGANAVQRTQGDLAAPPLHAKHKRM